MLSLPPRRAATLHRRHDEGPNAEAGLTRAEENALGAQWPPGDSARRIQPGQSHRAGTLHIVVEAAQPVLVPPQQAEGARIVEVLELNDGPGKNDLRGGDELLESVVRPRR